MASRPPLDQITCVHGQHYVGDWLGLIAKAASWLAEGGRFVANLDLANFRHADGRAAAHAVTAALRRVGVEDDRRKRLAVSRGPRTVGLPLGYLGVDDGAGPNSTGQPAVGSYYCVPEPPP